jgi:hypothetical protein
MAVAVVMRFRGGTLERYDLLIARMGFEAGGPGPAHGIFHWVAATDEGIVVTAVWESKRFFEQFAVGFGVLAAEVGVAGPPEITYYDIHSYLTAG